MVWDCYTKVLGAWQGIHIKVLGVLKYHVLCSQQNDITQDYRHYQMLKMQFWLSETKGKGLSAQNWEVGILSHSMVIISPALPPPLQSKPSHLCPVNLQLSQPVLLLPSCSCIIYFSTA